MKNFSSSERKVISFAALAFVMAAAIYLLNHQLTILYNPKNSVGLHTVIEFISISISFSIFTYGMRAYVNTQSRQLTYLSVLFLVLGSIDLLHSLSFKGMPYLFGESSFNKATWYWLIARMTGGIFLIPTLLTYDEKIAKRNRNRLLVLGLCFVAVVAFVISYFDKNLPLLVLDKGGSTALYKQLEIIVVSLQIIVILTGIVNYVNKKKEVYLYVSLAIFYILFSEVMLAVYDNVLDVYYWTGHLYKVVGYFFMLRGAYFYFIDEEIKKEKILTKARQELDQVIREQHGLIFKVIKHENKFIHTLCNGDLLQHLHLPEDPLIKKSILTIFPEKAPFILKYYQIVWEKGEKVTFELEIKNLSLYFTLKPVFTNDEISEIIGTVVDLTKLKGMEAQIRENEKLGVLGELAAGIAHEVRNPLTTLKGFLQLIKADNEHYEKSFVDLMLNEVDRIEMITDEFMSVARPQARVFKQENIVEILEYVVKFLQPQGLLKGVEVHLDFENQDALLICEKNQLKQVFINLIKNAFEAMPSGGNIYIKVKNQIPSFIEIQIIDEGIGMPEDVIQKIGQPFFTLKEGGNGLGLMMCQKIIDAHNGTMTISSIMGKGTTFRICLPAESDPDGTHLQPDKEKTLTGER